MPATRATLLSAPALRPPVPQAQALPQGEVRRLKLRSGETVVVRRGALWLTREGDALDHLLQPGCGHVAAQAQEVVVEAVGPQPCHFERHRLGGPGLRRWWAFRPWWRWAGR